MHITLDRQIALKMARNGWQYVYLDYEHGWDWWGLDQVAKNLLKLIITP